MTPLVAVAVARSLAAVSGVEIRIKPPNDIYSCGRKLAGILSEARTGKETFVVVGIGVNVGHQKRDFPLELQESATSLAQEMGSPVERILVASRLLQALDAAYDPGQLPGEEIERAYVSLSRAPFCDRFPQ